MLGWSTLRAPGVRSRRRRRGRARGDRAHRGRARPDRLAPVRRPLAVVLELGHSRSGPDTASGARRPGPADPVRLRDAFRRLPELGGAAGRRDGQPVLGDRDRGGRGRRARHRHHAARAGRPGAALERAAAHLLGRRQPQRGEVGAHPTPRARRSSSAFSARPSTTWGGVPRQQREHQHAQEHPVGHPARGVAGDRPDRGHAEPRARGARHGAVHLPGLAFGFVWRVVVREERRWRTDPHAIAVLDVLP